MNVKSKKKDKHLLEKKFKNSLWLESLESALNHPVFEAKVLQYSSVLLQNFIIKNFIINIVFPISASDLFSRIVKIMLDQMIGIFNVLLVYQTDPNFLHLQALGSFKLKLDESIHINLTACFPPINAK